MNELKPCPFCGSEKLKFDKKSVYAGTNGLDWRVERHTWSVRCNVCNARGGAVGGKVVPHYDHYMKPYAFNGLPDWQTTDDALKQKAAEAWNRRAEHENTE